MSFNFIWHGITCNIFKLQSIYCCYCTSTFWQHHWRLPLVHCTATASLQLRAADSKLSQVDFLTPSKSEPQSAWENTPWATRRAVTSQSEYPPKMLCHCITAAARCRFKTVPSGLSYTLKKWASARVGKHTVGDEKGCNVAVWISPNNVLADGLGARQYTPTKPTCSRGGWGMSPYSLRPRLPIALSVCPPFKIRMGLQWIVAGVGTQIWRWHRQSHTWYPVLQSHTSTPILPNVIKPTPPTFN